MARYNLASLRETVDEAGTAQPLSATSIEAYGVTIKALADNTGDIYVGDSNVSSTNGFVLDAGEELTLKPGGWVELNQIYIDAGTTDDGVSAIYYK